MNKHKNIQLQLLSYSVIAYMVLAFGWWSVLLFTKNDDAFLAKKELMAITKIAAGEIQDPQQIETHPDFLELQQAYQQQEWMITGEVLVFVVIMAIGLWLIHNGYNKEIKAAEQRRNFLLSITHELKSPIASIRLVLDTFKKRVLNQNQKEKLLKNGLTETERLHQLVNNLLLSARLESTYQPNQEMVDLRVLSEGLIEGIKAKHPQATISLNAEEDLPFVKGDKIGLSSVILNLLENALKYSPEEKNIKIDINTGKGQVILNIADHGIGIPDREKKNVFERFYRIGNEDTRRTKGTGLGLYIVKQIVLAHQGNIKVLDNQPKGSIFRVHLPAEPKPQKLEKAAKKLATLSEQT